MEGRELRYYNCLYEAAAAINSSLTPESVLAAIVENVTKSLDVKGCSIMLLTPDRKVLLHTAHHGLSKRYVRKGSVSADISIAETLKGRPVTILDATMDARVQYREQAKKEGIASLLSVPVKLRGEVVGVLRVYTAQPRRFTDSDLFFVSAVANLGAIALENARLHDSVKKGYDALRYDIAEWRAALGYEWIAEESAVRPG